MDIIKDSRYSLLTLATVFSAVTYFMYFSFGNGLVRLIYMVILCIYPVACLLISQVAGRSMKNEVL